ncbi:MFS transporter [Blastococcus sp. SYSU D00695]
MRAYLDVWRLPSAPALLLGGLVGRLPAAMVPLALLLMVQEETGSFAVGGISTAAIGIAMAVMAPILGRLADRRSPRPVLLAQALVYPLLLAVLVVVVRAGSATALVVAASAAAGAATPLVSGTVRALWARTEPVSLRPTAFALDATTTELVFVVGPALVAVLAVPVSPVLAVAVAGAAGTAGSLLIAVSRPMRAWPTAEGGERRGLLATVGAPGVARVLLTATAVMTGFGALEVAIPAFATEAGTPGAAGVLVSVWSVGSVFGGLWFGSRVFRMPLPKQYVWSLLAVALGTAPLAAASSTWALGAVLFVGGSALAPMLTVQNALMGQLSPAGAATEAFTWLSTVTFGAAAVGTAVAGLVIESRWGVTGAFLMATAGAVLALLLSLRTTRGDVARLSAAAYQP